MSEQFQYLFKTNLIKFEFESITHKSRLLISTKLQPIQIKIKVNQFSLFYSVSIYSRRIYKLQQIPERKPMKKLLPPIDAFALLRFLHLHTFIHIYRVFFAKQANDYFSTPRFQLFKTIKVWYKKKESSKPLFFNILFSFQNELIIGSVITLIFASCNLFVPQLIKSFLQFMTERHVNKSQRSSAESFILKFFIIQFLRIVFGQHSKRLFYELAIQIESSLCRKLVRKALSFQRSCRQRMHKSQIMQLENVDLKLIFTMFKNMYMVVQAPFTIIVAIILLFRESHVYGFIGIYWFLIAFLLQRELDSKMIHCNQTKLKLIDQRSKVNYQLFGRIKEAKIIHYEDLIVEKNNDLFIEQNHDHQMFYQYSTLYDITLLILPIVVVVTISLFDLNNDNHITVEQVYIMLELLGICYNPMKSFRTINISLHDGFHSLKRLEDFFDLPDEVQSTLIHKNVSVGELAIQENTKCAHPNGEFQLQIKQHIQLKPGDRLIVLGKKGQGKNSFLKMLMGQMKKIQGAVFINSKTAASLENHFFRKVSLLENIIFSDNSEESLAEIRKSLKNNKQKLKEIDERIKQHKQKVKLAQVLYKQFGLQSDFASKQGLNTIIDEKNLTKKQMKKISLMRTFVANPDIYIMEFPFSILDKTTAFSVQKRLRQKQQEGKTIIMTETNLQYVKPDDRILIFEKGVSIEYDSFEKMVKDKFSQIYYYFKSKEDKDTIKEPDSARKIVGKFKSRVVSAMTYIHNSDQSNDDERSVKSKDKAPNSPYLKYRSMSLAHNIKNKKKVIRTESELEDNTFWKYFLFYIKSVSFFEMFFILLIIGVAEFLHIFIHYFIGHLDEDQHDNPYMEFQNILMLEFILTMALALIIYFEGEVSSLISIIQGNTLYEKSIKSLVKKPIDWFYQQFSVKLADKFNHDYEEIFIACHSLLGIYKNIVILIITLNVVSTGRSNIFVTIFLVCAVYLSIGLILRKVQHKVVKHYYDYKYEFVKIFEECLEGGLTIQIFGGVEDVLKRTNKIYQQIAAYKLAESYTAYGEELFCDFTSLILLTIAFFYGLQIKVQGRNYSLALIGTTIHLLLNVSEVLKNIVKLTINFETFFRINIAPFLETAFEEQHMKRSKDQSKKDMDAQKQSTKTTERRRKSTFQTPYDIEFENVALIDPEQQLVPLKEQRINLSIKQESTVSIFDANQKARAKLVQALTKNYQHLLQGKPSSTGTIKFGKINISDIPDQSISDYVTVIMTNNFYWTGATLRQNIAWGKGYLSQEEEQEAVNYAKLLNLDQDLQDFDELGLDCPVSFNDVQTNSELNKKIAVLRTLIKKPKIVILKNTSSFIGETSITQLIKNAYFCTIIKVTGNSQEIPGMTRAIYMQNLKVMENDKLSKFENNPDSKIGKLLEQINMESYEYFNKAVFSPRKWRKKKDPHKMQNFSGYDTERSSFSTYSYN